MYQSESNTRHTVRIRLSRIMRSWQQAGLTLCASLTIAGGGGVRSYQIRFSALAPKRAARRHRNCKNNNAGRLQAISTDLRYVICRENRLLTLGGCGFTAADPFESWSEGVLKQRNASWTRTTEE
jgi:hypothetical protein